MKRKAILFFISLLPLTTFANVPESQMLKRAEMKVDAMFRDLKEVSNPNSVEASKIKLDFEVRHFASPDQDAPNEFGVLGFTEESLSYTTDIAARNYVNQFQKMFRSPNFVNCTFSYDTKQGEIIHQPEHVKGEAPPICAQVVVRKVYSRNGKPFKVFNDTLIVGLNDMKIQQWANEISRHHIGGDIGGDGELLNVEQMKINAAIAYERKQYKEAYRIYQSIIEKYPDEGEPYYRMAVLLDRNHKYLGLNLSAKKRHQLTLEYLEKAQRLGGYKISEYARNMYYWLTC